MGTLLVGGGFFVGYEIVARLLRDGHDLTVVALDPPPDELRRRVEWLPIDRNDGAELRRHLAGRKFDVVFDNVAYNPDQVEKLLQAVDGRTNRLLLTSTVDIYPKDASQVFAEHQEILSPSGRKGAPKHQHYMRGKRGCEKAVRASGLPWTVIRPALVTGRWDNQSAPPMRSFMAAGGGSRSMFFPSRLLDGGPILLRQDDECTFNLIWVSDLAAAVSVLLQNSSTIGHAYNVAGDEVWTSERLIMALSQAAGRVPDIVRVSRTLLARWAMSDYLPAYGRGPVWSLADNQKLKRAGWRPTPPGLWMADLIEAMPPPLARPSYERRLQEIALARHVRRQRESALHVARPCSATTPDVFTRTAGRIDRSACSLQFAKIFAGEADTVKSGTREFCGIPLSRFGIGTWRGDTSEATDIKYIDAIIHAVKNGINVIDTAINYRAMQAERCIGRTLKQLEAAQLDRSLVLLCTKGGFVTHDFGNTLPFRRYVRERYIDNRLLTQAEANRRHCIRSEFIRHQLDQSFNNLRVKHIDIYYLHNPEIALTILDREEFYRTLGRTFEVLEQAVAEGRIGCYGLATWHGLTSAPSDPKHISLARTVDVARSAAGADHHFKVVQMPFNALSPTARTTICQEIKGTLVSALEAAHQLGLYCFTSATVGQEQRFDDDLVQRLRAKAPALGPHGAMLRLAKSVPRIGTALIGMRDLRHVDEAVRIAKMPPFDPSDVDFILANADAADSSVTR
jgi:aryl-alcohol dehydrogenase-like predicted oxidoreductase/nucleoside-diphosphate-sugar epimerase